MTAQQSTPVSGVQSQPTAFTHHIYFDGDIVDVINYREEVAILRDASPLDIVHIHIETGGGDLYAAKHIISNMKQCQAHLITEVNGICASAGTLIFLAGDEYRLGEFTDMMFHTLAFGYSGKANNVAEYVEHTSKTSYKFFHSVYKHFLSVEEIDKLISGTDYWFDTEEVVRRLNIKGEALRLESEDFEPSEEELKSWDKERLLDFMLNEDYDNASWVVLDEVLAEENTKTPTEEGFDVVAWDKRLHTYYDKLREFTGSTVNLNVDNMHVEFSNMNQIWPDGFFMIDGSGGFHVDNKPEQIKYSVPELKSIADNLGITYSNNATKKVMSKLVLEFVQRVVAILNS